MAMDGDTAEEAAVVVWTLITVGVALAGLLTDYVGEDVSRRSSDQGNQGPLARGEGAAGSSATDARDQATWPESALPWNPL